MKYTVSYEEARALEKEWVEAGVTYWWSSDEDGEDQWESLEEAVDYRLNNCGDAPEDIVEAYLYFGELVYADATDVWTHIMQGTTPVGVDEDKHIEELQVILDEFCTKLGINHAKVTYTVKLTPDAIAQLGVVE